LSALRGKQASQSLAWLVANDVLTSTGCGFSVDLKKKEVNSIIEEGQKRFSSIWGQETE
jgi:hypothetical protein